ncbi:MAG: sigma-70 family RNA polymerase sigma factor [Planctomycetota bacterium]
MSTSPPITVESLLAHAAGVRALAFGLLGDEHAADDVVQETWIAALERSPSSERLGGWLRRVARHLALKRRRGEGRRSTRERLASRAAEEPGTDHAVAERESLRRVVDAVLDLDEVYSRVVLLRYFRGLGPAEIARLLGVPVATVDSRLHRARRKLRERLDAESGGRRERWAPALAAATGWRGGGAKGSAAAEEGTGMLLKMSLLAAGGLVAPLGASIWLFGAAVQETGASGAGGGAEQELARTAGELDDPARQDPAEERFGRSPAGGAEEGEGAEAEAVADPAALPHDYLLAGHVLATDGVPIPGASVHVAPLGHPLFDVVTTDAEGRFQLAWQGASERMSVVVWPDDQHRGFHPAPAHVLELSAGASSASFTLRPRGAGSGVRADVLSSAVLRASALGAGPGGMEPVSVRSDTRLRMVGTLGSQRSLETRRFTWPVPNPSPTRIAIGGEIGVGGGAGGGGRRLAPSGRRVATIVSVDEVEPVRIRGTVLTASGEPAAGAPLVVRFVADGTLALVAWTDEDGAYTVRLEPGIHRLTAGGGELGVAEVELHLTEEERGGERTWSPLLERGMEVRGRVVLADGEAADGWRVELERRGDLGVEVVRTRADDGSFAFPNAAGAARLLFVPPGSDLPAYWLDGVFPAPDAQEIALPERAQERGSLQVTVSAPDAAEPFRADLWLLQQESGRATWLPWDGERRFHRSDELPLGTYRVVAGTLRCGYVDLGLVEVTTEGCVELTATLPAPGSATVEPARSPAGKAWTLLRRGADSWSELSYSAALEGEALSLPLPRGEYLLAGEGVAVPFEVQTGVESAVRAEAESAAD